MAQISYRQFKNNYPDLRLLPYSNESLDLCEIIEWQGPITRRHIWFSGQNIIGRFNSDKEKELIEATRNVKMVPASFASIRLDRSGINDIAASIPNVGLEFEGKLETSKLVGISFEECTVRRLEDDLLERILDAYSKLNARKKRQLKRILFLSKLFYSKQVVIEAKSTIAGNIEAELISKKAKFEHSGNRNEIFKIEAKKSPFAIGLASFKDYVL